MEEVKKGGGERLKEREKKENTSEIIIQKLTITLFFSEKSI